MEEDLTAQMTPNVSNKEPHHDKEDGNDEEHVHDQDDKDNEDHQHCLNDEIDDESDGSGIVKKIIYHTQHIKQSS